MAGVTPTPTISLRERSFPLAGAEERLSKWVVFSLFLHFGLIVSLFIIPFLPSRRGPAVPIYTVDLVGGEKIGGTNFGTELAPAPAPKEAPKKVETEPPSPISETKKETKKEKAEKAKPLEKKAPAEEKIALKESVKKEPAKKESTKEAKSESADLDSIRERRDAGRDHR